MAVPGSNRTVAKAVRASISAVRPKYTVKYTVMFSR
jgi:hypothetical protein